MTTSSRRNFASVGSLTSLAACAGILFFLMQQSLAPHNPRQARLEQTARIDAAQQRAHYDGLRQSIMQSTASLPDVAEALTQPYHLGVANTLYALHKMHHVRPLHYFMDALWRNDQQQHPELNWAAINSATGRIALATTLMRIKITNTNTYIEYIRGHQNSQDPQVLSQVGMGLGFNADPADLPQLQQLAESDNQKIAEGAITGLSTFQGNRAKRVLIELADKYSGSPRGKFIKQMLRDFYAWPPRQPYKAQSPLVN